MKIVSVIARKLLRRFAPRNDSKINSNFYTPSIPQNGDQ